MSVSLIALEIIKEASRKNKRKKKTLEATHIGSVNTSFFTFCVRTELSAHFLLLSFAPPAHVHPSSIFYHWNVESRPEETTATCGCNSQKDTDYYDYYSSLILRLFYRQSAKVKPWRHRRQT